MKVSIWIGLAVVTAIVLAAILNGNGSSDSNIRQTLENAAKAVEYGLNSRSLAQVETFFAASAEGANEAGLKDTLDALRAFGASMSASDQVQFHSFEVQSIEIHQTAGLARATYRLHFSVVRGSQIAFGAVIVQDLALIKTPRGWRISGGDQPQLNDIRGQWAIH